MFVRAFSASHTRIYLSLCVKVEHHVTGGRFRSKIVGEVSCSLPLAHLRLLRHRTAFFPTMGLCASSKPAVPSGMKLHVLPPSANSHGCIAVVKDLGMDIEVRDTAEFAGGISHGPYLFSESCDVERCCGDRGPFDFRCPYLCCLMSYVARPSAAPHLFMRL